jgi:hypothetical protein
MSTTEALRRKEILFAGKEGDQDQEQEQEQEQDHGQEQECELSELSAIIAEQENACRRCTDDGATDHQAFEDVLKIVDDKVVLVAAPTAQQPKCEKASCQAANHSQEYDQE